MYQRLLRKTEKVFIGIYSVFSGKSYFADYSDDKYTPNLTDSTNHCKQKRLGISEIVFSNKPGPSVNYINKMLIK